MLQVVTIEKSKPTVEGFRLIDETKVDALAVVDEEGHLCGTLSASDLRGLGTDMFARLKLPVAEFLEKVVVSYTGLPTTTNITAQPSIRAFYSRGCSKTKMS